MTTTAPNECITVYEPERFYRGYTLFCHTYDALPSGGRARVLLLDMEGNVAHEWHPATAVQLLELL
ncbi:MAG: hypothetical protein KAX19_04965, partial [Candidatus Brocadiae bacterium]|nr:hypothetical protein [Candidatus Brocadiia bacterium]